MWQRRWKSVDAWLTQGDSSGVVKRVFMNVEIAANAGSGDPAYMGAGAVDVSRVPPRGGVECKASDAGSGDPAYMGANAGRHYAHR